MEKRFTWLANATARLAGSAGAFLVAVVLILAWGMSGPFFGYSETWPLVINTGTTIITFLMQRKITRQFCDWLASLQGPGA